ncbi:MAG: hypothetical protein EZS28_008216 [Streblomastix strix]|uniref:Uncharacterized protein n=1 Tax=Streblomastix strix TaxID=222440 RepID=A0A5J4WNQ8_9EUKA|nr:MAG: hypothetical protein EZS28_008216 [Streblomastix strix]
MENTTEDLEKASQTSFEWNQMKMAITIITMFMIMTTTIIIDMIESGTAGMICQIWKEVGKGREQHRVKVQVIDKTMVIGLQVYTAKFRNNISGASVYMPGLQAVQKEAFRTANDISPNLDEESSVSWTSPE